MGGPHWIASVTEGAVILCLLEEAFTPATALLSLHTTLQPEPPLMALQNALPTVAVVRTGLPVIKKPTSRSQRKKRAGLVFMEFTLLTHVPHHSKQLD